MDVFFPLCHSYFDGGHEPQDLNSFKNILRMLLKVHDCGFVHGDIRMANLLFNDENSVLIDFDLARKEGEFYDPHYRPDLKWKGEYIRHIDAARDGERT